MKFMNEEQIKFMSACVIQALTCIRESEIIHRDIMMKNIVMDKDKYFNVIDFSFSINYKDKNNKKIFLNTYDMVSPPEMLNLSNYDYNSDYYRLGSIIYFLIFKTYPLTIKRINNKTDINVDYHTIKNYSENCIDFMNKLITSDYKKRIGFNDINELKNHSWFIGLNWTKLKAKEIISPFEFVPNINYEKCKQKEESLDVINSFKKQSKRKFYQKLIKNFDYINIKVIEDCLQAIKQ